MLWVFKRTVSMRRFFWASKTNVKTDGWENIHNFSLKFFAYMYLDLRWVCVSAYELKNCMASHKMLFSTENSKKKNLCAHSWENTSAYILFFSMLSSWLGLEVSILTWTCTYIPALCVSRLGSSKTVQMCRLKWAYIKWKWDEHQTLMNWLICCVRQWKSYLDETLLMWKYIIMYIACENALNKWPRWQLS